MYEYNIERKSIGVKEVENKVWSKIIYGKKVGESCIPLETSEPDSNPIVIFKEPDTQNEFGINKDRLSLGWLSLGAPGSGKTNQLNIIVDKLIGTMNSKDVLIIFDTKGDYYREFGNRIPEEFKYVIGNNGEYKDVTSYHNIFAEIMPRGAYGELIYTEECDIDALEIASALFENMQSEHQPIFPSMSEQIVAAVIIYFMRTYWKNNQKMLNNKEFIKFFQTATNEDLITIFNKDYMKDQKKCTSYIGIKGVQSQGVDSYIASALKKIFIGAFAKSDSHREISMRELINSGEKAVVFIEYDLIRGNTLGPIYKILIDQALKYALGGRAEKRKDTYIVIDEWALLPKLKHMAASLSFGRSQGVKLLAGLQNISAIEEIYGEAGAKNILAGFQNIICFNVSDYNTRQFVINRLGVNYENISFSAQNNSINVQREGHCVEEWVLLDLKRGMAVVSLAEKSPFLFSFPKYN